MNGLARDWTDQPVSRSQTLRREQGQGGNHLPCSAVHEQDWQPYPADPYSPMSYDGVYPPSPTLQDARSRHRAGSILGSRNPCPCMRGSWRVRAGTRSIQHAACAGRSTHPFHHRVYRCTKPYGYLKFTTLLSVSLLLSLHSLALSSRALRARGNSSPPSCVTRNCVTRVDANLVPRGWVGGNTPIFPQVGLDEVGEDLPFEAEEVGSEDESDGKARHK